MLFRVENIVKRGEIASYKQFLISHNVFHNYVSLVHQNAAFCGNWLTAFLSFPTMFPYLSNLNKSNHLIIILTLSQMTNFKLSQTQRLCRQQFQI